jgi:hypothetical protein
MNAAAPIFRFRFRAASTVKSLISCIPIVLAVAMTCPSAIAQESQGSATAGYIAAMHPADGLRSDGPDNNGNGSGDSKLSGLGVIEKVVSDGPAPVFSADGHLLRIAATADLTFSEELNSLADVGTNVWIHYEGTQDERGMVLVSKATFLPAKPSKFIAISGLEFKNITVELPRATPPAHKEKVRYSDSENRFKAIDDSVLQERMHRIGMSVVPAYQKALPDDHPSKIQFRFYAVDNEKLRSEICSTDGMILLPKPVIERLKSDDQLAAVIADGIVLNLQRQAVRLTSSSRTFLGVEALSAATGLIVPGIVIVGDINPLERKILVPLQQQRGRIALALLNEAGYDLHQAPEAWRLLAPKQLPANTDALKYPDLSTYQLNVIKQQYQTLPVVLGVVSGAR